MTSFMNIVPSDVTIHIANHLDITSFSKFLATCKYAHQNTKLSFRNKVSNNIENLLKDILSTVVDYNMSLLNADNKYKATKDICKSLFKNILNAKNGTDMQYLVTLLDQPVRKIVNMLDVVEQDVHIVLNQVIDGETLEREHQQQMLKIIQDYLFTQDYNVVFELFDNKKHDVKYRFLLNINLSKSIPKLKVMIIDEANEIDLCDNAFSDNIDDYIKGVEFTADGEVAFTATDEGIEGLTSYICKVFGNGVFTHKLTDEGVQLQICNFLNQPFECCEFYREVVSGLSITQQASSKITNYINSNIF